jgi:hypothetical protein
MSESSHPNALRLLPKERTRPGDIRNHRRQTTLALPPSPLPPTMKLPSLLRPVQSERNEDGELLTPRTQTANVVLVVRLLLGGGRSPLEWSSPTCSFSSSSLCSLPQLSISLLMIVNVTAQSAVNIALPLVLLPCCRTARREKNCQFRFPACARLTSLSFPPLPFLSSVAIALSIPTDRLEWIVSSMTLATVSFQFQSDDMSLASLRPDNLSPHFHHPSFLASESYRC